jgi:ABC-type sugar transport system substrate-binding protein
MKQLLKKSAVLGATALLAAAALTGCSSSGSSGSSSSNITVGYSTYTVSNPFFAGMLKGLHAGAKKYGFKLVTTNANSDPAQQVTDIQNLVNQGVNYILLTPADGKAIAPGIAAATSAKIPVISIADSVTPKITSTINLDNVAAGAEEAKLAVASITKANGSATGNIVNIQGASGTPSAEQRSDGFVKEIKKYPGIKVVATADGKYDTQTSNTTMSTVLQANPKIDAVVCGNDAEAVGVSAAIKSAGKFVPVGQKGHIFVAGIDGSKPSIVNVQNGVQDVSISQNPIKMSQLAMDYVEKLSKGKKISNNIVWPYQEITKENINSPEVKKYGVWANEVGS